MARRVVRRLFNGTDPSVIAGPFKGMRYTSDGSGAEYTPKIVGTYELETASELNTRLNSGHDLFVDIGAAEGYFAIGFLLKNADSRCVAFEMNRDARRLLAQNARLNGVHDRLQVCGEADAASLHAALVGAKRPWVLCDCEGAEVYILDPEAAPALRHAHVLLEVHGHRTVVPDAGQNHTQAMAVLMQRRFGPTHRITSFAFAPRTPADWPASLPADVSDAERLCAMAEHRYPQAMWQAMEPIAPSLE